MIPPLDGLQVIEGSAFVAAPSGGMTLAQLGADVIRFDQIGGGLDHGRWPLTEDGASLYWAGLNKNKRSLAIDLRDAEIQELLSALIAKAGTFLTNFPARGWMSWESLVAQRPDLVMLAITGNRDGTTALDYTVNAAIGYPAVTGPVDHPDPVNHVFAAWDVICGQTAALGILAADRHRLRTGHGANMTLALFDVALAAVAALGHVAEAQKLGTERERYGNDLYGAFGAMFGTSDGHHVYAVAISGRQWRSLVDACDASTAIEALAKRTGLDFAVEGDRFAARSEIAEVLGSWIAARSLSTVRERFDQLGVCWGPYQSFSELVENDPRCSLDNAMFRAVDQPGIGEYLTPGSPIAFDGALCVEPSPAPRLGQHSEEILGELGLSTVEIGRLVDGGSVAVG